MECEECGKAKLSRDEIGICRKMLSDDTNTFFCLQCFADYLGCSVSDLKDKIEQFKEEGCTLFG